MSLDINNQSNHADTAVYADSGNLVLVSPALWRITNFPVLIWRSVPGTIRKTEIY